MGEEHRPEVAVVEQELLQMLSEKLANNFDKDDLDEMVLSYVVGLLDDVDSDNDDSDCEAEAEAMREMLEGYFPGAAEAIPAEDISGWLHRVAAKMRADDAERIKNNEQKSWLDLSSVIAHPPQPPQRSQRHQSSSSTSSVEMDGLGGQIEPKRRIYSLSEEDNGGGCSSSNDDEAASADFHQTIESLLEMFPYSCSLEVSHCLQLMAGDVERTAQLIMHRHDNGQDLKPTDRKIKLNKVKSDDKDVKERILGKYGFVDQEEDKRYHRPTVKKADDKKMIRYRDGKIVSTKGERFSQVSKAESEEMKKSIVNII